MLTLSKDARAVEAPPLTPLGFLCECCWSHRPLVALASVWPYALCVFCRAVYGRPPR